jgi:hypothetical protein
VVLWRVLGGLRGGAGWLGTAFLAFFASGAGPRGKLVLGDQGGVEVSSDGELDSVWVVAVVVGEVEEFDQGVEGFFGDGDGYEAQAIFAAGAEASGSGG